MIPFIYEYSTLAEQANLALGQYYMRMTLRFVQNDVNNDNNTNLIFQGKHNIFTLGTQGNPQEITSPQLNIVSDDSGSQIEIEWNHNGLHTSWKLKVVA